MYCSFFSSYLSSIISSQGYVRKLLDLFAQCETEADNNTSHLYTLFGKNMQCIGVII
jgi:hypothetical protein